MACQNPPRRNSWRIFFICDIALLTHSVMEDKTQELKDIYMALIDYTLKVQELTLIAKDYIKTSHSLSDKVKELNDQMVH